MKTVLIAFCFLAFVAIYFMPAYGQYDGNQCGCNQVWANCTTNCPARCIPDDRVCPAVCGPPGCVCAPGFKLNESGVCVRC